jgi:secreted trypsin-like serine protease
MPAAAVINGTEDTSNTFSNVGLVYIDGQPECTGTLYRNPADPTSRRYVMTAAHCIFGESGQFSISFAEDGFAGPYLNGTAYYNQGFTFFPVNNSLQNFDEPDAAVIVLDQDAPAGLPLAELPSVGQVDTLAKKQLLTVAGYGANDFNANHPVYGARFYGDETIVPGQRAATAGKNVKVTSTLCFGDSGGPNFIKGTRTTVAIVSWGQSRVCSSPSYVFRIDNADALNFLQHPTTGVHQ